MNVFVNLFKWLPFLNNIDVYVHLAFIQFLFVGIPNWIAAPFSNFNRPTKMHLFAARYANMFLQIMATK